VFFLDSKLQSGRETIADRVVAGISIPILSKLLTDENASWPRQPTRIDDDEGAPGS